MEQRVVDYSDLNSLHYSAVCICASIYDDQDIITVIIIMIIIKWASFVSLCQTQDAPGLLQTDGCLATHLSTEDDL